MSQIDSVAVGTVIDTNDPLRRGRVQIRLPSMPDSEASWARALRAPDGSGILFQAQDEVLVAFEQGDIRRPVVIGALWNGSDRLPAAAKAAVLRLPTGGSLQPILGPIGASRQSASLANVLQQAAPWLASMECQVRTLRVLKPLIDVVQAQPAPPRRALQDLAKAAADLAPCLLLSTPASAVPVARDLLCLIIASLISAIDESKPGPIPSDFRAGLQSVLDLSALFLVLAGVQPIQLGPLTDTQTLQDAIDSLQTIADAFGGCG